MADPYVPRIDRRVTLAWLLGAAGAAAGAGPALAQSSAWAAPAGGYGTDPDLLHPKAPWPRLLDRTQLNAVALLCDFILPAAGAAPSARALGVPDFIDEWVSAPYPSQSLDRHIVVDGLAWLEAEARRRSGQGLADIAPDRREALFASLVRRTADPALARPHAFFRRLRALVIGAYYTTRPGFEDIGYIGNVPLTDYPGPSPEVLSVLDARLKALGV